MTDIQFLFKGRTPLVKIDGQLYHFKTFKKNPDKTVTFTACPLGSNGSEKKEEIDPILGQIGRDP